jgi:hypothetical protein
MCCVHYNLQGGVDEGQYRLLQVAAGSFTGAADASSGSLLRGSVDVLHSLLILPPADLLLKPISCMMAFQVDGHLIPVQEPVQLKPEPGSGARRFTVSGVKGFAHLIIENAVAGCSRWVPQADEGQGGGEPGFVPGLLVVNLSSALQQQPSTAPTLPQAVAHSNGVAEETDQHKARQLGSRGPSPTGSTGPAPPSPPGSTVPALTSPPGSTGHAPRWPPTNTGPAPPNPQGSKDQDMPATAPSHHTPAAKVAAPSAQPQKPASSLTTLSASVQQLVPTWDPSGTSLHLQLPGSLADTCSGVRLEVGGALLPAGLTQQLKLVPVGGTEGLFEVAELPPLKFLVDGAALLPCKALAPIGSTPVGRPWELVIRVRWPLAAPGEKVCPRTCKECLLASFKGPCITTPAVVVTSLASVSPDGWVTLTSGS